MKDLLAEALDMFNAGFNSKAAQKRALDKLNSLYDRQREIISNKILEMPKSEKRDFLYWGLPHYLHLWKSTNVLMYGDRYPEETDKIQELLVLRKEIKASAIVPPMKKESVAKKEAIMVTIKEMLEKNKAQYVTGLKLTEYFGHLNVDVNAHWVTNEYGTSFIRCFYYLFGKLMALNTIIAIAEKHEEIKKGKS